jgi:cytochrome c-type biogenesis protein CcmF
LQHVVRNLRQAPRGTSLVRRASRQGAAWWGMVVAHAGVGIFVIGVTLVKGTEAADDVSLRVGASTRAGDYIFTFEGLEKIRASNYVGARATFAVTRGGKQVATLYPEKRFYTVQQMPTTEAAIDRGFARDLYVSLGEPTKDGAWTVRIQHKPFMNWIWAGCLVIAFGGLLAAVDRRYRARRVAVTDNVRAAPAIPVPSSSRSA